MKTQVNKHGDLQGHTLPVGPEGKCHKVLVPALFLPIWQTSHSPTPLPRLPENTEQQDDLTAQLLLSMTAVHTTTTSVDIKAVKCRMRNERAFSSHNI